MKRLTNPRHWRDRADEAHKLADYAHTPYLVALLNGIGDAFDRQAEVAERQLATVREPSYGFTVVKQG